MVKKIISFGALITILAVSIVAFAYKYYTGYSGAPGSLGTCASSCHGSTGGTIQITGFPTEYVPDSTYTITISHSGGSTITNFNGSCRIGSGQQNAGVISAGTNTVVYNATGETNGIHFSTSYHSSGTFNWTAPGTGTGFVKLYIAGQQGLKTGPNTALVLTSNEYVSGIHGTNGNTPTKLTLSQNYPNPFNPNTTIRFTISDVRFTILKVYDVLGNEITTLVNEKLQADSYEVDFNGEGLSNGVYFYRLEAGEFVKTRKCLLIK